MKFTQQLLALGLLGVSCLICIFFIDQPLTTLLYTHQKSSIFQFFHLIRDGFSIPTILIFLLITCLGILLQKKSMLLRGIFLLLCECLTQFVTQQIKMVFGRIRPFRWIENQEYGFNFGGNHEVKQLLPTSYAYDFFDGKYLDDSFPSGHTSSVFCLAFSVGLYYPRLRVPLLAYAMMVALARVVTTIHYLGDIIAGIFLALIVVLNVHILYILVLNKWK